MKRSIKGLTNWVDYEKRILKNKRFLQAIKKVDYEYQLAKSLIELRLKRKMSQKDLAKKIGTKQPVISRIETASVKPSISLLERIAEALGAKLEVKFHENKRSFTR